MIPDSSSLRCQPSRSLQRVASRLWTDNVRRNHAISADPERLVGRNNDRPSGPANPALTRRAWWLFGFHRGVTVASRSQLGRPAEHERPR